jgi:hypothetical protein
MVMPIIITDNLNDIKVKYNFLQKLGDGARNWGVGVKGVFNSKQGYYVCTLKY